jgi:hypothetical protein
MHTDPTLPSSARHKPGLPARSITQVNPSSQFFPRFVCRVGTIPADTVDALSARRCVAAMIHLRNIERELAVRREEVSSLLHKVIGATDDSLHRRLLLAARRSLFNLKSPEGPAAAALQELLLRDGYGALGTYVRLLAVRDEEMQKAQGLFVDERERSRECLSELAKSDAFQRGLLMSSPPLFRMQAKYHGCRPSGDLRGKFGRLERALLRYLLRTAMKATPFGTFCAVVPGLFEHTDGLPQGNGSGVHFRGSFSPITPWTRLDKRLLAAFSPLLLALPSVRKCLPVTLNPTITAHKEHFEFLALVRGREVFQRLKRTPVIELALEILKCNSRSTFADLTRCIAAHPDVQCDIAEAERFALQMLETGVIRLQLGVQQQEVDWDYTVCSIIRDCDDPAARTVVALLKGLRETLDRSQTTSLLEWSDLVERATALLSTSLNSLGFQGDLGVPFRDDSTANAVAVMKMDSGFAQLQQDICRLVELTSVIAWPRVRQASMRHFFDQTYPDGQSGVPLLKFYEDYYRGHFKAHLAKEQRAAAIPGSGPVDGYRIENPFGLAFVDTVLDAETAITNLIANRCREDPLSEEVRIEFEEIASITGVVPRPALRPLSVALIGVVTGDPAAPGLRFITKGLGYALGHGRMFSRWLHMLPDDFQACVYSTNVERDDLLIAEICNDDNHNANLHPPLVDCQVSYPNSDHARQGNYLDPTALIVTPDPEDPHALRLLHIKSQKRVIPLDLGFAGIAARPPLYQLLAMFAPPHSFGVRLPPGLPTDITPRLPETRTTTPKASKGGSRDGLRPLDHVLYRPRIVLGTLVVSRRCWIVPRSRLPIPDKDESDFDFFHRVSDWRLDHGLPDQTYVRLEVATPPEGSTPDPDMERGDDAGAEDRPHVTWRSAYNDHKPQFIDFTSPLMVNLLRAVIDRPSDASLLLAERYPIGEMLPAVDGHRYTVEEAIQVELRQSGSKAGPTPGVSVSARETS